MKLSRALSRWSVSVASGRPGAGQVSRYATARAVLLVLLLSLVLPALETPAAGSPSSRFSTESYFGPPSSLAEGIAQNRKAPDTILRSGASGLFGGYFTENVGQVGRDDVRYYASLGTLQVGFAESAVLLHSLDMGSSVAARSDGGSPSPPVSPGTQRGVLLRLGFEDANRIVPEGRGILTHRSNYFLGNDPARWRTDVPSFAEVVYPGLYPGIDLVYRVADTGLKYDFIVHPGGDPTSIRISYEGVDSVEVEASRVVLRTGFGTFSEAMPRSYQEPGGDVDCRYVAGHSATVSVACGEWDRSRRLVIDPLLYSTFLGGGSDDMGGAMAVDSSGYVYVAGVTNSADFPTTAGAYDTIPGGDYDVFIAKLDPGGTALQYSTLLGGSSGDLLRSMAVDASGSAYVTGQTSSSDFPTTLGALDTSYGGSGDDFVTKLDPWGSNLEYSTFFGAYGVPFAVDVDDLGRAFVLSTVLSDTAPTTFGAYDSTYNGGQDEVITELDASGSTVLYATYLGGTLAEDGRGLVVDPNGLVYVTGFTDSNEFPTTPGANDTSYNGGRDAYVAVLDPAGNFTADLLYSTFLGGSLDEMGWSIAVDGSSGIYVAGYTRSGDFPTTPGAFDETSNGGSDSWVMKIDWNSSALVYSTYLGGSSDDGGDYKTTLAVDSDLGVYVSGFTESSDFPVTSGSFDPTFNGLSDVFVVKMGPLGDFVPYSTFVGGSSNESGLISLDDSGGVYLTGTTSSTDFPTRTGSLDVSYNGGVRDAFVAKLEIPGRDPYVTYLGGGLDESAWSLAVDSAGNAYVTGRVLSTDFPVTTGTYDMSPGGGYDVFVAKMNPVGRDLAYATYLGGDLWDEGRAVAVDISGNAYVTGYTYSSNTTFPVTPGAFDPSHGGGVYDAFVAKLSAAGDALLYATYVGGTGYDYGAAIAVDTAGNAYLAGHTSSTNASFPITFGSADEVFNGPVWDAFVAKLNSDGSGLAYATYLGGSGDDHAHAVAVDGDGLAVVAGKTGSDESLFPVSAGAADTTYNGGWDAFIAKLSSDGSSFVYATYLGGSGDDIAYAVALDANGNAYVTGDTTSAETSFPETPGAFDTTLNPSQDAFVAKLDSTGSTLQYATYLGGNSVETGEGIAVDAAGNAYVAGHTGSTDTSFPLTSGASDVTFNGGTVDAFVAKLDGAGSALLYSTYIGGGADDKAYAIATDTAGNAYVGGTTNSDESTFPVSSGSFDTSLNNASLDAFVAKLNLSYEITMGTSPSGLQVAVDGVSHLSPFVVWCSAGDSVALYAPSPQTLNFAFAFDSWSDEGNQSHDITCSGPAPYTAYFHEAAGPFTSNLTADPNPATTDNGFTLYATVSDVGYGGSAVWWAEIFVDTIESNATGILMNPVDGGWDSPVEEVLAWIATDAWAPGNYTLYVHGMDVNGNWGSFNSTTLTLLPPAADQPPVADAGPDQTGYIYEAIYLTGTGSYDPDGAIIRYAWTQTAGPNVFLNAATASIAWFNTADPGLYTFNLQVEDLNNSLDNDTVNVTVENRPPVADAGALVEAYRGATVFLDGTSSYDPEGATPLFNWTQSAGPVGVTLNNATRSVAWFNATDVGLYTFNLTVTDNFGASDTDTVSVAIDNVPPTASLEVSPNPVGVNQMVTFNASGSIDLDGSIVDYTYDFGDGTSPWSSADTLATHTYTATGVYNATLTVTDNDGALGNTTVTVTVEEDNPPNPVLGVWPGTNGTRLTVFLFDGQNSTDDWGINGGLWDLGDGTVLPFPGNPNVTHSYAAAGVYTVTLTLTDTSFQTANDTATITVVNLPPTAALAVNPPLGGPVLAGEPILVTANGSSDEDGISTYEFSFGDATVSGPTLTSYVWHAWSSPGNYAVNVTVTDTDGATAAASVPLEVVSVLPLTVTATANVTLGVRPLAVQFEATAYGGDPPYNFQWNFRPGDFSLLEDPTYVYEEAGFFLARVTVWDEGGNQSSATVPITVSDPMVLDRCTVTPTVAALGVNETLFFSATGWNGSTELLGISVSWDVLGGIGTVTPTGQLTEFTAEDAGSGFVLATVTLEGHVETCSAPVTVTAGPPPRVAILAPTFDAVLTSATLLLMGTATDATSVEVRAGDDSWQTAIGVSFWTAILDLSTFPVGSLVLEARAWNGTVESTHAFQVVQLSWPLPTLIVETPAEGAVLSGLAAFRGTATAGAAVEASVDGGAWIALAVSDGGWEFPWDTRTLGDGSHTLTLRAVHRGQSSVLLQRNVTVDNLAEDFRLESYLGDSPLGPAPMLLVPWNSELTIRIVVVPVGGFDGQVTLGVRLPPACVCNLEWVFDRDVVEAGGSANLTLSFPWSRLPRGTQFAIEGSALSRTREIDAEAVPQAPGSAPSAPVELWLAAAVGAVGIALILLALRRRGSDRAEKAPSKSRKGERR